MYNDYVIGVRQSRERRQQSRARAHTLSALQRVDKSLILSVAGEKKQIFNPSESKHIQMI